MIRTIFDGSAYCINDEAYEIYCDIYEKFKHLTGLEYFYNIYINFMHNKKIKEMYYKNTLYIENAKIDLAWPTGLPVNALSL
jgi:hypothetical protein